MHVVVPLVALLLHVAVLVVAVVDDYDGDSPRFS